MLEADFYSIDSFVETEERIQAVLSLHASHAIFTGHFPQHPVVPGVCMMQIIRELAEKTFQSPLRIKRASQLKFLTMIDPNRHRIIHAAIQCTRNDQAILLTGRLFYNEVIFMKCDMELNLVNKEVLNNS